MLEQEGEGVVDWCGIDDVVVVEDEDETVLDGGDLVEQGRQDRFCWWRLGGEKGAKRAFSDLRGDRPQGGDEVGQEARGVVVPFVKRQPGGRSRETGDPFAEERGLAEAGGGGDEGKFAVQSPSLRRSIRRGRRTTVG